MIDAAQLSPWLWVAAPVVVIVAYTVFGLTGFGATAISVPVLAHFLPISFLVPMMVLLDLVSASLVGIANREQVSKRELARLLPWMFLGFVVGVTVLVGLPDRALRVGLGAFAIVLGLHGIANPRPGGAISKLWAIPAGIAGGAVATVFGAGGPIYATYMSGRTSDKGAIRSTLSTLISISALARAAIYAISGLLFHLAIFAGALVLAPFVWLGVKLGGRIHTGLSHQQMRRVVGGVLVLTGVGLLVRSLA